MTHWTSRAAFTLFLLSLVIFFFIETLLLSSLARLVPLIVVVPTLALLIIQLSIDLRGNLGRIFAVLEKAVFSSAEDFRREALQRFGHPARTLTRVSRNSLAVLWVLLLIVLVYIVGLPAAALLYTFLYLRIHAGDGWVLSAGMAAGVWCLIYGVLVLMLGGQYYQGLIWTWLYQ